MTPILIFFLNSIGLHSSFRISDNISKKEKVLNKQ
jgi:hypothetical protein